MTWSLMLVTIVSAISALVSNAQANQTWPGNSVALIAQAPPFKWPQIFQNPPAQQSANVFPASSFDGIWSAKNFYCFDSAGQVKYFDEKSSLKFSGQTLTATKITGDPCITAGEVTWRADLGGSHIEYGRAYSAQLHGRNYANGVMGTRAWFPGAITFLSLDRIELSYSGVSIVFTRGAGAASGNTGSAPVAPTPNPTAASPSANFIQATSLDGNWFGMGYFCYDSNGQLEYFGEQISFKYSGQTLTATKITGDPCVAAGEVTWKAALGGPHIQYNKIYSAQMQGRNFTNGVYGPLTWFPAIVTFQSLDNVLLNYSGQVLLFTRTAGATSNNTASPPVTPNAPPPVTPSAPPPVTPNPQPPVTPSAPPPVTPTAPPPVTPSAPPPVTPNPPPPPSANSIIKLSKSIPKVQRRQDFGLFRPTDGPLKLGLLDFAKFESVDNIEPDFLIDGRTVTDRCYGGALNALAIRQKKQFVSQNVQALAASIALTPLKNAIGTGDVFLDLLWKTGLNGLQAAWAGTSVSDAVAAQIASEVGGFIFAKHANKYVAQSGQILVDVTFPSISSALKDEGVLTWQVSGNNNGTSGQKTGIWPTTTISAKAYYNPFNHYTTVIIGADCQLATGKQKRTYTITYEVRKGLAGGLSGSANPIMTTVERRQHK